MDIEALENMIAQGRDSAMLRFTLGRAYDERGDTRRAVEHLAEAVRQDPDYSAAWKLYGRTLADSGDADGAADAYERGIEVAEARGDKQAAKEMRVFLKRLKK